MSWQQFQKDLEEGEQYQDFVQPILLQYGILLLQHTSKKYQLEKGESSVGIEVKYQRAMQRTGNVFIETWTHGKTDGILKQDNAWCWVTGDYETIFIASKNHLKFYYEKRKPMMKPVIIKGEKVAEGFLLSKNQMRNIAFLTIDL